MMGGMTDASAFGRRTAALLSARSEHLPRVLDVTVLGERLELELEAQSGPTLEHVLTTRRSVTQGEAVTIMVSAVRAVAALHEAGFCGVSVAEADIVFDADGRPVLQGFAALGETVRAGAEAAASDWRAVAALADRLGLVAHGRAAGALGPAQVGLGLALANVTANETEQSRARLEDALFDLAEPEPVRLDAPPAAEARATASPLATRKHSAAHRRPSSSIVIEALDAGPAALLAGPLAAVRARVDELVGRVQGRARLLLIAGGVTAALSVAALCLVPGSPRSAAPSMSASTRPPAARSLAPNAAPSTDAALMGTDPVAAASVLLAKRDGCLAVESAQRTTCLAAVADGVASGLDQPARPLAGLTPSLLERTGDSALVALTPKDRKTAPASALLMRTEAGWRLRQLYEN